MSAPPDFLGLALGMIRQRQQQRAEAQQQERQQLADQARMQAYEQRRRDVTFANALKLAQHGTPGEEILQLYPTLSHGEAKFIKGEAKRALEGPVVPKGTEMTDISSGLAGMQQLEPDPLKAAVGMIGATKQLPFPEQVKDRLLQRGMFLANAARAAQEREKQRVEQQSQVTEQRQTSMLGKKEAARAGRSEATSKAKPVANKVAKAYKMYRDSNLPYDQWVMQARTQNVPSSILTAPLDHPDFTPDPVFKGVPFLTPRQENQGAIETPYGTVEEIK